MAARLTIKLKQQQKISLQKLKLKRNSNLGERAKYILLLDMGKKVSEIAEHFGRNKHTIRLWIKRYQTNGIAGLEDDLPPGRPDKKTSLVINELEDLLNEEPIKYGYQHSGWQINMLMDYFSKEYKEKISYGTMTRALKKSGWVYKRFSKRVPHNAPSKEEKSIHIKNMISAIREEADKTDVEIFFEDESHFANEPYVERGWFKRGEKKRLRPRSGEKKERCLAH